MDTEKKSNKVTITDIAEKSGVSPTTVSLVLRNKPGVGAKTRQRVIDTAELLGYINKPNQSSANNSTYNIGLVMRVRAGDEEPLTNQFYAPIITGIETICRSQRNNLLYENVPVNQGNVPIKPPRILSEGVVNGVIFIGMGLDNETTKLLDQKSISYMLVDAYGPKEDHDSIIVDNENGATQAIEYLVSQGHKHIGIVGSQPQCYPSIQERRTAYTKVIVKHGLPLHYIDCPLTGDDSAEAIKAYLKKHPEVTAIFGANDAVAIACLQSIKQMGKSVPEDISIVGFDNIVLAQHVYPPLCTIRVDKMGMGRMAAQLLINRITYPQSGYMQVCMKPDLILRDSVRSNHERD